MSDSSIAIVSSGGTLVDTRTNAGGDHRQVIIIGDQTANDAIAVVTSADAGVATSEYGMVVRPLMTDAAKLRVSAILDNGSVSAKSSDAATMRMSAINSISSLSPDAALFRVSAIGVVSSLLTGGTANIGFVSARSDDAGLTRVSALGTLSAFVNEGSISAKSSDATNLRISADLFPNTVGGLTIYNSISVSSMASIKSTAGAPYGYFAWNTDTKPNYIKLFNASAGAQLGDAPKMVIALPASAAGNMEWPHGLVGFTNGIMVGAVSGVADSATSLPNTSAVGLQLFYK